MSEDLSDVKMSNGEFEHFSVDEIGDKKTLEQFEQKDEENSYPTKFEQNRKTSNEKIDSTNEEDVTVDPPSIDDQNVETETTSEKDVDPKTNVDISPESISEPNEASNDVRFVDADGWEDLLGSGRLRKRVIVEGDPKHHPSKGSQVRIHFKGKQTI